MKSIHPKIGRPLILAAFRSTWPTNLRWHAEQIGTPMTFIQSIAITAMGRQYRDKKS
jgi:hypothetical protein